MPVSVSSFVRTKSVTPLIRAVYRATGASYQPVRRGRPVVVPNSNPAARRNSPDSSNSSVGNGPDPTRVVYAFTTAIPRSKRLGATPDPVAAPPLVALLLVTNG